MSYSFEFRVKGPEGPALTLDYVDRILCIESGETYSKEKYCNLFQRMQWFAVGALIHANKNYMTKELVAEGVKDGKAYYQDLADRNIGPASDVDKWFSAEYIALLNKFLADEFTFVLW